MPSPIAAIGSVPSLATPASGATATPDAGGGFGEALAKMVNATEASSNQANSAVGSMLEGTGDVHDAMIALQRAEIALQMTVQVRNKLVQAYQDIMRMPV